MSEKIEIQIAPDVTLVAETYHNEYNEIMVYIKRGGCVWQDLAVIGSEYSVDLNASSFKVDVNPNSFMIDVFGNSDSEDYTDRFYVNLREDDLE